MRVGNNRVDGGDTSCSTAAELPSVTWTAWNPISLIGHLGTLMGNEAAAECIFEILISPENGANMLVLLLRIGKWNNSSSTLSISMGKGIEVLTALRTKLIQLEKHLPFGVGPLVKVL
jgi:hypothetical protein